jgi:hypothetical protein
MAPTPTPTHPRAARPGGTDRARPHRNAYTNAGVNRHQAPRTGRGTHRRRGGNEYAPVAVPVRPTFASRMTYGDVRGRGGRPQYVGRLQDQMTSDHGESGRSQQVNQRAQVQGRIDTRGPMGRPALHGDDINDDINDDIPTQVSETSSYSSLFCESQPDDMSPPPPPAPHRPALGPPPAPIRMVNDPHPKEIVAPKRPINKYRGKDPIKRLCQNKKLQAILADKPIPRERQKVAGDRMMLRMGVNGIAK